MGAIILLFELMGVDFCSDLSIIHISITIRCPRQIHYGGLRWPHRELTLNALLSGVGVYGALRGYHWLGVLETPWSRVGTFPVLLLYHSVSQDYFCWILPLSHASHLLRKMAFLSFVSTHYHFTTIMAETSLRGAHTYTCTHLNISARAVESGDSSISLAYWF